jgi:hypothetical protein
MRRLRRFQRRSSSAGLSYASSSRRDAATSDVRKSMVDLARESLRCVDIAPRAAAPEMGLTTALSIESCGRADVLDLDRIFFMGDGGTADVSWFSLPGDTPNESFRLLLRVVVTGPIRCEFVVGIPVANADSVAALRRLSYLFAADRLAFTFDAPVTADSAIIMAAPSDRRALLAAIDALRYFVPHDVSARSRG